MSQTSKTVRAQVASLVVDQFEGRLDWGEFLEALPDEIGDDEEIHELIELLQMCPLPGFASEGTLAEFKARVLEKVSTL
jgi:Uma2 family endonuclease